MNTKESFQKFCSERVRSVQSGYQAAMGERVHLKDILKAYNRWVVNSDGKRITKEEFVMYCEELFGDSRGKHEYVHLRVFLDDDDLEEFDKEHSVVPTPPPPPISPIQKYLDFFSTTATSLRQEMAVAPTHLERYRAMETMERLAKLQPKLTKLQAAVNLDQKPVIKRLQSQLDLELEVFRLSLR